MKHLMLLAVLISCSAGGKSQDGIVFSKENWKEVQQRAEKEGKYIFVDCYATWCIPCKFMADSIFPMPIVGRYFNDQYISIKIQFDSTSTDDQQTKSQYAMARMFGSKYQIESFPTYLFFSPRGKLVNRFSGANRDPKYLLDRATEAQEYSAMVDKCDRNELDSTALIKLSLLALKINDTNIISKASRQYAQLTSDVLAKSSLNYFSKVTRHRSDTGFAIFLINHARIDSLMGPGWSANFIRPIVSREYVHPIIDGVVDPDWNSIMKQAEFAFPDFGRGTVLLVRAGIYQKRGDWPAFARMLVSYVNNYPNWVTDEVTLNSYAWEIFGHCTDRKVLKQALVWSTKSVLKKEYDWNLDTQANILYKLGRLSEALALEEKAYNMGKNPSIRKNLDRMKNGQKTW